MRVFRVQDSSEYGPYHTGALSGFHEAWDDKPAHPDPRKDEALKEWCEIKSNSEKGSYYFCFSSKEAVYQWFHKSVWQEAMHRRGHTITEWEVDKADVFTGEKQSVFRRKNAVQVASHPILEMEPA